MTAVKPTSHQLRNHNLREAFLAEDAARKATEAASIAMSAAQAAQSYNTMIQAGVNDLRTQQDSTDFVVKAQSRRIKELEMKIADCRNQCLIAGVGGAVLASILSCLVLAPIVASTSAPQPQPRVEVKK